MVGKTVIVLASAYILIVNSLIRAQNEEKIQYYVDLVTNAISNGFTYEFPTSAREYTGTGERINYGTFDFVVSGSGIGGSVAANRLSEEKNWTVLVLEAGTFGDDFSDIPNMYFPIQFSKFNWALNSTPQSTACLGMENNVCLYPRGKGVGGSSLINGLVYARGYKSDFVKWAALACNSRWGYESVLRYFKKSENFNHNVPWTPVDPAYHAKGGYLNVEYHIPDSPQLLAFLKANEEIGIDVADYNANKLGASPAQLNTIHGRRDDEGKAFIRPVKDRSNLQVLTESYVTKILISKRNKRAYGVEFSHRGKLYFAEASKEVILSAGALQSPQILMLSGIGPRKHLEKFGIKVIQDLEVGSTVRDNPTFFGMSFGTNYTEPVTSTREQVIQYLHGVGQLAIPGSNQGVGFYESSFSKGTGSPDIELMFIPANCTHPLSQRSFGMTDETNEDVWGSVDTTKSFIMYIVNLHAVSLGTVRLRSSNPYDYPLIDSKFLSDPENRDINVLYEGIQLALKLMNTTALKALDTKLQGGPLRACKQHQYLSKNYWYCAIRQVTSNLYHPLGSCQMGTDPKKGAVVDSELKVFGIQNLRISDASVFPLALAGHPIAPTVMVGEQLGDLIKMAYRK